MRLADRLGMLATQIDKRLLVLVQDVQVCGFREAFEFESKMKDTLAIGHGVPLNLLYSFVKEHKLRYLVQEDHDNFIYNLIMCAMICKFPDAFLKNPLPAIIRSNQTDTVLKNIEFTTFANKKDLMAEVSEFLSANNRIKAVEQNALLIANELMLNALYVAPVDDEGKPLFSHLPRNSEVKYPTDKKGEIFLAYNNQTLVVGCRDPFGSVDEAKLSNRLSEVFESEEKAKISEDGAAAPGMGLKMVIENSSGFGMLVKKGKETFVFATVPLGAGNRKIYEMSKNLYLNFY